MDKPQIWIDEWTDKMLELSQQRLSPLHVGHMVIYNPTSQDFDFRAISQAEFYDLGPIDDVQQDNKYRRDLDAKR